jgi:hypothetical protein
VWAGCLGFSSNVAVPTLPLISDLLEYTFIASDALIDSAFDSSLLFTMLICKGELVSVQWDMYHYINFTNFLRVEFKHAHQVGAVTQGAIYIAETFCPRGHVGCPVPASAMVLSANILSKLIWLY